MEMEIGRFPHHQVAGTGVSAFLGIHMHVLVGGRCCIRAESCQIVFEGQDDKIAGIDAKSGRLCAVVIEVAVTSGSVALPCVVNCQFNFQHTVAAAQFFRLGDHAAWQGTRASFRRTLSREERVRLSQAQAQGDDYEEVFQHQLASEIRNQVNVWSLPNRAVETVNGSGRKNQAMRHHDMILLVIVQSNYAKVVGGVLLADDTNVNFR